MYRTLTHRRRWIAGAVAAVGFVGAIGAVGVPAAQATVPSAPGKVGVVCTNDTAVPGKPTFNLETDADYITLPDGNTAYMYGYKLAGGHFQHPSPVLCVKEGDTVTITLKNRLARDVSIMFPGQTAVLANGAPAVPQSTGGVLTSLTNAAAAASTTGGNDGGTITYSFVADHPGTFLYESGTDSDVQVRMGLFGALIVRPTMGDDFVYDRADSQFTTMANTPKVTSGPTLRTGAYNTEEFLVLLSEIDPYLNQAIETVDGGGTSNYSLDDYHPRYWLINGRGFPDSVADNGASWLPNQPYGALAEVRPINGDTNDPNYHPFPAVTRYLNVGTETYPFHPHGNNGTVIGRDGNPLESAGGQDLSYEKFAVDIGPGQTYDVLSSWHDDQQYDPSTNPVPVEVPQVANQVFGMFYSGSPYLGENGTLPPGQQTLNQCGEFYIIAHNHALYQITSWGVNMTGPITYMRVDPNPSNKPGCPGS
jgi:FtsP/CotA-like multicopper oxidase with cupredoxin domain